MIDLAEHAARLQRLVESAQRRVDLIALDPVVQVAEGEHEIRAARRRDLVQIGVELRDQDFFVKGGFGLEPRQQLALVGKVLRRRGPVAACGDVKPPVLQVGRENLHVVAAAARQNFHHGAVVPDAEEREHLQRMAVAVACHVAGGAVRGRDPLHQAAPILRLRGRVPECGDSHERRNEQPIQRECAFARFRPGLQVILLRQNGSANGASRKIGRLHTRRPTMTRLRSTPSRDATRGSSPHLPKPCFWNNLRLGSLWPKMKPSSVSRLSDGA